MIAARMGRSRKVPIRSDWEQIKFDIVRAAVKQKFAARPVRSAVVARYRRRNLLKRPQETLSGAVGRTGPALTGLVASLWKFAKN